MDRAAAPSGGGAWHRFRVERPVSRGGGGGDNGGGHRHGQQAAHTGTPTKAPPGSPSSGEEASVAAAPASSPALAAFSCLRCRQSKKRCDRVPTGCMTCRRIGATCTFPANSASPSAQAAALRARVQWLSDFVDSLASGGGPSVTSLETGADLQALHAAVLASRGQQPQPQQQHYHQQQYHHQQPSPPSTETQAGSGSVYTPQSISTTPDQAGGTGGFGGYTGPGSADSAMRDAPPLTREPDLVPTPSLSVPYPSQAGMLPPPPSQPHQQPQQPQQHQQHQQQQLPLPPPPQLPAADWFRQPNQPPSLPQIDTTTTATATRPRFPAIRSFAMGVDRMRLVRSYFRSLHRSYPFLYEAKIVEDAEGPLGLALFDEGYDITLESARLYFAMVIGLEALWRFGHVSNHAMLQVHTPYAAIVQMCLSTTTASRHQEEGGYLGSHRGRGHSGGSHRAVLAVEVLLLVTIFSLFDPDGWSPWRMTGMLAREAVLLGLNRRHVPGPQLTLLEVEFRHRLFWSIFSIDRMIAGIFGLPLAVQDYDANLPLPGVTTEEFAASQQAEHNTTLQIARQAILLRDLEGRCLAMVHRGAGAGAAATSYSPPPLDESGLRPCLPGGCSFGGGTSSGTSGSSTAALPSMRERRAMIEELRAAADNWYTQGCLLARREDDHASVAHASSSSSSTTTTMTTNTTTTTTTTHFHNTITWLNTNYHSILILLYCPSLFNAGATAPSRARDDLLDLHHITRKYVQSAHAQFADRQLALNYTTLGKILLVGRIMLHCYFNLCCEGGQASEGEQRRRARPEQSQQPQQQQPQQPQQQQQHPDVGLLSTPTPRSLPSPSTTSIVAEQLDIALQCQELMTAFMPTWVYAWRGRFMFKRLVSYFRQRLAAAGATGLVTGLAMGTTEGYGPNHGPIIADAGQTFSGPTGSPTDHSQPFGHGEPPADDINSICDEAEQLLKELFGVSSAFNYLAGEPRPLRR